LKKEINKKKSKKKRQAIMQTRHDLKKFWKLNKLERREYLGSIMYFYAEDNFKIINAYGFTTSKIPKVIGMLTELPESYQLMLTDHTSMLREELSEAFSILREIESSETVYRDEAEPAKAKRERRYFEAEELYGK